MEKIPMRKKTSSCSTVGIPQLIPESLIIIIFFFPYFFAKKMQKSENLNSNIDGTLIYIYM